MSAVAFPPRDEPYRFRLGLEAKYRDQLRRTPGSSFVDLEGDVVWIQEYIRYRVNGCSHSAAVQKVFEQIDGRGIQDVCGSPPAGQVDFPPRNEPFDFRNQLEAKYRDQLRRTASLFFVDIEGDIVWVQEYLRYRVNACDHTAAQQKVFDQIDGRGVQADCFCSYSLAPGAVTVGAAAGSNAASITRTAGTCSWTASSDVPWITLTAATSGSGNATLGFNVDVNSGTSARTGTITVHWSDGSAQLTVTQSGQSCSFSLNPTSQNVVPGGASLSATVTASPGTCAWTAAATSGPPPWITISSGASGTGTGVVTYTVTPNSTPTTRSGTITVQGTSGGSATLTLTQLSNVAPLTASFQLFDLVRIPAPTTKCEIHNVPPAADGNSTPCTLDASGSTSTSTMTDYSWTVQYTYGTVKTLTLSGVRVTFLERCDVNGAKPPGLVFTERVLSVQLTVRDSAGNTITVSSGAGSQPALQIVTFTCGF